MSSQVRELMASGFGELRHEPTAKRIQAVLGGATVVDSTRAVLVWEPRRFVPSYAVPAEDVRGDLVPAGALSAAHDLAQDAVSHADRLGHPPHVAAEEVGQDPGDPPGRGREVGRWVGVRRAPCHS